MIFFHTLKLLSISLVVIFLSGCSKPHIEESRRAIHTISEFIYNRQRPDGTFIYEYRLSDGVENPHFKNHSESFGAYALAVLYDFDPQPKYLSAIKKNLDLRLSQTFIKTKKGGIKVLVFREGKNRVGEYAYALMTALLIKKHDPGWWRANQAYSELLTNTILWLQRNDGEFNAYFTPDEDYPDITTRLPDPYFTGLAVFALAEAWKHNPKDTALESALIEAVHYIETYYQKPNNELYTFYSHALKTLLSHKPTIKGEFNAILWRSLERYRAFLGNGLPIASNLRNTCYSDSGYAIYLLLKSKVRGESLRSKELSLLEKAVSVSFSWELSREKIENLPISKPEMILNGYLKKNGDPSIQIANAFYCADLYLNYLAL
ncbi:MAG: hypothetical protein SFT81_00075 [Candidatus Caenarcaniphilales bacterium]|nr:hypothetical protein [Candidatus Caenarcaniphilales bacterium]